MDASVGRTPRSSFLLPRPPNQYIVEGVHTGDTPDVLMHAH